MSASNFYFVPSPPAVKPPPPSCPPPPDAKPYFRPERLTGNQTAVPSSQNGTKIENSILPTKKTSQEIVRDIESESKTRVKNDHEYQGNVPIVQRIKVSQFNVKNFFELKKANLNRAETNSKDTHSKQNGHSLTDNSNVWNGEWPSTNEQKTNGGNQLNFQKENSQFQNSESAAYPKATNGTNDNHNGSNNSKNSKDKSNEKQTIGNIFNHFEKGATLYDGVEYTTTGQTTTGQKNLIAIIIPCIYQ
ncbi:hypothetical protein RFI_23049 [Reticulomyxa filosa]|uniref:Uncharacterized protein n=1 Tax=Reticulomyxa filosa TaxID=46433 RepID=X6MMK7_RETFI|nr:hypothetical protein RFI_23049 [Reticulomyxa filosa]|eukprot:ETO14315.1 hypothetical protein RFI_23049 [Reticulomyxa filosa]